MKKKYALICVLFVLGFMFILPPATIAQNNNSVKGKVTDDKGSPLPGVTIKLVGTTQGTVTDVNGNYSINAPLNSSLEFSFVSFDPKTIQVTGSQLNVQLTGNQKQLNEVVVVGYGTQKRSDITGSVSSVPKARLSQLPVTNVLQAIEGSVAGVNISTTSSVPGSQPSTLVRGQNSITAQTGPYVVVDGIPLSKSGGSLNDINPNDIASIEILKDASAVAIYGTNGSNGVMLITTKRGNSGKPVIRYSGYGGVEDIPHVFEPLDGPGYVQKYADYLKQTGQKQTNPVPNYNELKNYNAGVTTDWIKEATQTGIMQDHNLSVSGGSENVKYYVSGDYLNQKGVVVGYKYRRINFRSNLDINVTNFLTVGTNLFYSNNNYDGGRASLFQASAMSPYGQEYNPDGTYTIYPMNPEQLFTNPMLGLTTDQLNRNFNLTGNGYAEIKFGGLFKGLKYRLNAGYTDVPSKVSSYSGRLNNNLLGLASINNSETSTYVIENLLYYIRDIQKHHFDFTGLYSSQQRNYSSATAGSGGFINDELSFNSLDAGATPSASSSAYRTALLSQMGRLNYSYDSRYLFTFTVRRDGSSVFGENTTKYGWFPSAALGWNISNERFMKKMSFIDNLKLRLSYGKSGNEAVDAYKTISSDLTVRYPFNGVAMVGQIPKNLGNANLHWETTVATNLGLDFSIYNGRLSGSADVYSSHTSGLLLNRSLPNLTGYTSILDNIGKTANKGIELTINTKNITGTAFRWESSIVFAANRNKIVDLYGDGKDDVGNRWFIGHPVSVSYDYKMVGIWQTGEDASKQDPGAKPGDIKFADVNGDGKITADDRVIIGQSAPKWTGGFTNTFHYKQFNLNVFIQTARGMTRSNSDLNYLGDAGRRNTPKDVGYWTAENGSNEFQSLAYTNPRSYNYPRDASYTRIKDVTLSYVFNKDLLDRIGLSGLTIYGSARNIYTFTKWIGWDPESNQYTRGTILSSNESYLNNYPLTRTFVIGANISLK